MEALTSGSREAARLMLNALRRGQEDDFRSTLERMKMFIPDGSPYGEFERRELLECVGEEVMSYNPAARGACLDLLEHIAGVEAHAYRVSRYLQ